MINGASILDRTRNFLKLYIYNAGQSEIPDEYHFWCALSLINACLGDRVWVEKFRGSNLRPNLYVMLLGPSAIGKDTAIDMALDYVRDERWLFKGNITSKGMIDLMSDPSLIKKALKRHLGRVYVVTPELSDNVGSGHLASAFVKHMTGWFGGSTVPVGDVTRMHGTKRVSKPCINWMAGTTRDWLFDCVRREDVLSGFFARVVVVDAKYNLNKRLMMPIYPDDFEAVRDEIRAQIDVLKAIRGEFVVSNKARTIEERWYQTRPAPSDEALIPDWKRQHDRLLKIAMGLAAADQSGFEEGVLMIRAKHMIQSQSIVDKVAEAIPSLAAYAAQTPDGIDIAYVMDQIARNRKIGHSVLQRRVAPRGIVSYRLRSILETLQQANAIGTERTERGGLVYTLNHRI